MQLTLQPLATSHTPLPQVSFCFVGQPLAMMLYYHDWRQGYTHPLAGLPTDALAAIRSRAL